MSSIFSCEDKRRVLLYVADNRLDGNPMEDEEKWQQLGRAMGRDWIEVRDAYRQWKAVDDGVKQDNHESQDIVLNDAGDGYTFMAEIPVINADGTDYLEYADLNGQLVEVNDLEAYVENYPQEVYINNNDQGLKATGKRALDLTDFDSRLLRSFENQSKEELELKRKEHEQRLKYYKMQIEQGKELHNEKMKILRAKLQAVQQQVHHIDHVICNKTLRRKFKSGPI